MNVRTILVAEDNADDLFLMHRALKRASIAVDLQHAPNGRVAIQYLGGQGQYADRIAFPLPQVVFLDIKMPMVDGFDVLRWIRANMVKAPVIVFMLTSSNLPNEMDEAKNLGVHGYATKPPTPELFSKLASEFSIEWAKG